MDGNIRNTIIKLLDAHRVMTVATLRPDGWPQATTVGFAHEGLTLYFLCGPDSQKARNIAHDDRVSLTIDSDTPQVMEIRALSMAARARRVTDEGEVRRLIGVLMSRYPEQFGLGPIDAPGPDEIAVFRVDPEVISVIDYTRGFGHADLVTV